MIESSAPGPSEASEEPCENPENMPFEASIIIPNFNNGRESSVDGTTNLLGDLLDSIKSTLADDPTPVEIVIGDDGSQDDSLHTARQYAKETWRDGQPFCRVIEWEHSGVLSRVLNRLMAETTGRIVCRFDGDVRLRTDRWLERVIAAFDGCPQLGVLGGRQLDLNGRLHSVGDLLFHPHGYQHIGAGAIGAIDSEPLDCDHVMGCYQLLRRSAFDSLGGYDESILRGQTIDLGVRLRQEGWRAMTDPELIYEHRLGLRRGRAAIGDQLDGVVRSRALFYEKWGFDRLCPDMDAMRSRLGEALVPKIDQFARDDRAGITDSAQVVENRVSLIQGSIKPGQPMRIVVLGGGDGAVANVLQAQQVFAAFIEDRHSAVEHAIRQARQDPRWPVPHLVPNLAQLPLQSGFVDLAVLDRSLERHANPISFLREAHRILRPDGVLLLIARMRSPEDQIKDPGVTNCFTPSSLRNFLANSGLFHSIDFVRRPFPHAEPDVLLYALRPRASEQTAAQGSPVFGDPFRCL